MVNVIVEVVQNLHHFPSIYSFLSQIGDSRFLKVRSYIWNGRYNLCWKNIVILLFFRAEIIYSYSSQLRFTLR